MEEVSFEATIDERGKIHPNEALLVRGRLAQWGGRKVTVTIARHVKRRTSPQNAWYWGVIVPLVGEHLSRERELPLTKDQTHYVLKAAFLGCDETALGLVPMESKTLNTEQFSGYCEKIRAHAATEWGLYIPSPGEEMAL